MAHQVCSTYLNNTFKIEEKFPELQAEIQSILSSGDALEIEDHGAGSKRMQLRRSVSDIYKYNCTKGSYAKLLHLLPQALNAKSVLEMGTSLGISTFYLSKSSSVEQIISLEGSQALHANAQERISRLKVQNAELKHTLFQDFLDQNPNRTFDLVYLDGHHSGAATLSYCQQLKDRMEDEIYILLDDIRWSRDMYRAFKSIRKWPEVQESMDLARMGLIHLKRSVQKV